MPQEDKSLLLKDLCARLPYGTIVECSIESGESIDLILTTSHIDELLNDSLIIKPYLRPMSSVTKEESAELSNIISKWFDKEVFYLTEEPFLEYALSRINYSISPLLFDYLNSIHVDYRGLIPKGLAIEVTKENNPYEEINL